MIEFLLPIFQAFLFYMIPTAIGRPIVNRLMKQELFYPFVTYFITGGFVLFLSAIIIEYGVRTVAPSVGFSEIFQGTVAVLSLVSLPFNFLKRSDLRLKSIGIPTLASVLAALPFAAIWTLRSPYSFNWDMLEHQTLANNMLDGKFSFMTSKISDTFGFDGYSSFLHTMIASSQVFYPTDMFIYWQTIGLIHFVFVILASYFITKEVTENKAVAYIAMLIAAGIFDSYISFTSLFFIPQTFTAVVSIFLFAQLFKSIKNNSLPSPIFVCFSMLFILLNHYIIGVGAIGIYLMIYIYSKYRIFIAKHFNRTLLVALIGILAVIAIFASEFVPLASLNSGEAASFTPTWSEKLRIMRQSYGWLLLLFFPAGLATILRWKGEVEALILTITFILMSVVLLQAPYVLKFYVLARFFVHIILAIGLYAFLRNIQNLALRGAAYVLLVAALLVIFSANAASWKEILRYHDGYTNISPNEVRAAQYLKETYQDENVLLISDPATQHILEPLTKLNTQGGAYVNHESRTLLDEVITATTAANMAAPIRQIKDEIEPQPSKRLLVLSGRYFLWQYSAPQDKNSLSFNIWYPSDFTLENLQAVRFLSQNNEEFKLVYKNPTVAIFEVKSE